MTDKSIINTIGGTGSTGIWERFMSVYQKLSTRATTLLSLTSLHKVTVHDQSSTPCCEIAPLGRRICLGTRASDRHALLSLLFVLGARRLLLLLQHKEPTQPTPVWRGEGRDRTSGRSSLSPPLSAKWPPNNCRPPCLLPQEWQNLKGSTKPTKGKQQQQITDPMLQFLWNIYGFDMDTCFMGSLPSSFHESIKFYQDLMPKKSLICC